MRASAAAEIGGPAPVRADGAGESGTAAPRPLWWYAQQLRGLAPRGSRLLQYSCGDGALLGGLIDWFEVSGYDDTGATRHRCRTNVPDAVVYERVDDIPSAAFDVVVWMGAIPRSRAQALVRHLERALAPGGLLVLIVPNVGGVAHRLKGGRWAAARGGVATHLPSQGEWTMIAGRVGFEIVSVQADGLWDPPYVPFIPEDWQRVMFTTPLALASYLPVSRWLLPAALGESLLLAARRKS